MESQRATTDKNEPFLKMGFRLAKSGWTKNGAKCNMGFGRITKNTPQKPRKRFLGAAGIALHQVCRSHEAQCVSLLHAFRQEFCLRLFPSTPLNIPSNANCIHENISTSTFFHQCSITNDSSMSTCRTCKNTTSVLRVFDDEK